MIEIVDWFGNIIDVLKDKKKEQSFEFENMYT